MIVHPFKRCLTSTGFLDYNHQTGKHTLEQLLEGDKNLKVDPNNKVTIDETQLAGEFRLYYNGNWRSLGELHGTFQFISVCFLAGKIVVLMPSSTGIWDFLCVFLMVSRNATI